MLQSSPGDFVGVLALKAAIRDSSSGLELLLMANIAIITVSYSVYGDAFSNPQPQIIMYCQVKIDVNGIGSIRRQLKWILFRITGSHCRHIL